MGQEFSRLLGLQLMREWFNQSNNTEYKRDILDCVSIVHYKSRNPYEEAGWLPIFMSHHLSTYHRLAKLPLRKKIARKVFTLDDLDQKIREEKVLEQKRESNVVKKKKKKKKKKYLR